MKRSLAASVAWLLAACEPDLDTDGAARCDERMPCAEGASCYRGFCIADGSEAGARELDSGAPVQSAFDAGPQRISSSSASESSVSDAGEVADRPDDARAPDAQALEGTEDKPDAAPSSNREQDAGAARPALEPKSATDAGGAAYNPRCTLEACCEEARKASESERRDGRWNPRKGKCGCADADVLVVLNCGGARTRAP